MYLNSRYYIFRCRAWLLVCAVFVLWGMGFPAKAQRENKTINDGWKFWKGDCMEASDSAFNDSDWTDVHLPHTWNTDAYVEKDYYRGIGWYRRRVSVPFAWKGKRIFLKLDAASKAADIYVNGKRVGNHGGGYTACTFDITSFLNVDAPNVLAVRVDNSRMDIPPVSGDFTFFGGIYRDVWLMVVPDRHFHLTDCGSEGVFITTPVVSRERGTIAIESEIRNDAAEKAAMELVYFIYHPDGTLLQNGKKRLRLDGGETRKVRQESDVILNPWLWTPETPYLYKVKMDLKDVQTGKVVDHTEHYTAFRWFRFDGKEGFFLNGQPYKLRGICRHQDQKPIGVALTDEIHRRDFRLMKEMGANFIRVSHYPQDDALLEMCDKLGMLAWEEIPIIDIVPDTPGYADYCEWNLREMIRQHYNHPSIIAWGYMNEILLVTQRLYKTKAELDPIVERTLALAHRLEKVLKEEDTTRVSTMAFHGSNVYNEVGLSRITDIVGWNLYPGWYGGDLTGFERYLEEQQRDYPDHPLIVSEYGAGSDKRLHTLNPRPFDFSSEYQQIYLEHYLPVLENTPYVCGGTHWNFIDFSSALRDESMSRINNKGLVYSDRIPKDVYFYYQAAWREDIPVLHIASRDWNYRSGIQQGEAPVILPVKVYSNLPEVELFIDGKPVGKKKVTNWQAVFDVPFTGKTPYLYACGVYRERKVEDGVAVYFTPVPERLDDQKMETLELAVNVGSNCFFTSDESHLTWLPDKPYVEGSWGYMGGKEQSTQTEIHQTADGPLYQTMREGLEGYRFDVPRGMYEVELLFTDIYRPVASAAYLLGKEDGVSVGEGNHFAIYVNGESVEADFAPYRDNGYFQAVRKRYLVQNKRNSLEINLKSLQGKCFLSGIKLRKL